MTCEVSFKKVQLKTVSVQKSCEIECTVFLKKIVFISWVILLYTKRVGLAAGGANGQNCSITLELGICQLVLPFLWDVHQ